MQKSRSSVLSLMDISHAPSIVFLHNPKAGGTSLASSFAVAMGMDPTPIPLDNSPHDLDIERWKQVAHLPFVRGHMGWNAKRAMLSRHLAITNFRNPVSRTVSLYVYLRAYVHPKGLPPLAEPNGPTFARSLSFADFIRSSDPFLNLYLDNFHTRQLLSDPWRPKRLTPLDLWIVHRRIAAMPWFYVCEDPERSIAWLRTAFPAVWERFAMERLNKSPARDFEITDVDREVIMQRNRHDAKLHLYAKKLLRAAAPSSVEV